jgi:hypothetical protein
MPSVRHGGISEPSVETVEEGFADADHRHPANLLRRILREHRGPFRNERSGVNIITLFFLAADIVPCKPLLSSPMLRVKGMRSLV